MDKEEMAAFVRHHMQIQAKSHRFEERGRERSKYGS